MCLIISHRDKLCLKCLFFVSLKPIFFCLIVNEVMPTTDQSGLNIFISCVVSTLDNANLQ